MASLDNIKSGIIYAQDSVDDLALLKHALSLLSGELSPSEKDYVLTNAKVALAGVTGYVHGAKGI